MSGSNEMRAFERFPIGNPVRVQTRDRRALYSMAINLSLGGILLAAAPVMAIGSPCEVAIMDPSGTTGATIVAQGRVVRSTPGATAIQFADTLAVETLERIVHPPAGMAIRNLAQDYVNYMRAGQTDSDAECMRLMGVERSLYRKVVGATFGAAIPVSILPVWLFRASIPPAPNWEKIALAFLYAVAWMAVIHPLVDIFIIRHLRKPKIPVSST